MASAQAVNIYTLGFAVIDSAHERMADAQWWIGVTMSLGAASGLAAQLGSKSEVYRAEPVSILDIQHKLVQVDAQGFPKHANPAGSK